MDKETFIAKVVTAILPIMPVDATDHDKETVTWSATTAWEAGCNVPDAILYCKTFEEVDPDLEEDVAFARRAELRKKYEGKHRGDGNPRYSL